MHTGFSLSLLAPAKLTVKGLQRPVPRIGLDKLIVWTLISEQSCSSSRRPSGKQCRADNSAENCFGKRTLKLWLVVTGLALETAGAWQKLGNKNLTQTWRLRANLAEARGWWKPARNLPKPGETWRNPAEPGGTRRKPGGNLAEPGGKKVSWRGGGWEYKPCQKLYSQPAPPSTYFFSAGFRQVSAGFRQVPPGSTGFRRVPPGSAGFRRVPPGSAGFCRSAGCR